LASDTVLEAIVPVPPKLKMAIELGLPRTLVTVLFRNTNEPLLEA